VNENLESEVYHVLFSCAQRGPLSSNTRRGRRRRWRSWRSLEWRYSRQNRTIKSTLLACITSSRKRKRNCTRSGRSKRGSRSRSRRGGKTISPSLMLELASWPPAILTPLNRLWKASESIYPHLIPERQSWGNWCSRLDLFIYFRFIHANQPSIDSDGCSDEVFICCWWFG
jgi:hypothetical protein